MNRTFNVFNIDERVELKIDVTKAANKISVQFEREVDACKDYPKEIYTSKHAIAARTIYKFMR